ncbi:MAG: YceH family protein [Bryobacteraceae bacterium]
MELLDGVEVRVLGTLLEKEATTPYYYPLSLHALMNACNQKSNREPVVNYTENDVSDAILRLRDKKLAVAITDSGRVSKYGQRISETLNLGRRELAVLCTLLLRGPQTLGEIKDRSERMYAFAELAEAERVLEKLAEWPGGDLVTKLARRPGQKEARYTHLLAGEPATVAETGTETASTRSSPLEQLQEEVRQLRASLDELRNRFDQFQAEFRRSRLSATE